MKKLILANAVMAAVSTFGAFTTASAADAAASPHTITGNAGLFTDYRFRGVSQTQNDISFQGGFDYAHSSGFYAGVWNSNIGFGNQAGGNGLETDIYGGYTFPIGPVAADIGLLQYVYSGTNDPLGGPGTSGLDTLEIYGKLGYMGFTLAGYYSLSDDYFGYNAVSGANPADLSGSTYVNLAYKYSFNDKLSLTAAVGQTDFDRPIAAGFDSYVDYSVGLTYNLNGFDLGVAYIASDNDAEKFFGKDPAEGDVVFSVKKVF
ncbi:MAG: TorF family putative porin [Limnobacter sp.]|nr:TorF family putative porin [Limnobacter sp.]